MASDDTDIAANTIGLTVGDPHAKKAEDAAGLAARVTIGTTGVKYVMPAAPTQGTGADDAKYTIAWAITASSLDDWTAANATAGPSALWWAAAREVSD